jgi:hypothetical protein
MVDPPLMGPSSLRNQQVSTRPSRITYVDQRDGMQGLRPIYQIAFPVGEVRQDIAEIQQTIREGLFTDYFRKLTDTTRRQITAEEIRALTEEKIANLSPLLQQVDDELLDPLIERTFAIALRAGLIPPPPQEIQGMRLRVEYQSIMAQAQRSMGLQSIERFVGFVGNAAGLNPGVLDSIDFDVAARTYASALGVAPKIVRDEQEIAGIRQERAMQQQAAQAAAQAESASKTALNLSKTDTEGKNALTDLGDDQAGAA